METIKPKIEQTDSKDIFSSLKSLRGILLIVFGLLSFVIVLVVATMGIVLGTNSSHKLIFNELVAEADFSQSAINNWFAERSHNLTVITQNPLDLEFTRQVLQDKNRTDAYDAILKRIEVEIGLAVHFEKIFLVDTKGQIILSTDKKDIGRNQKDKKYFQDSLLAPTISSPFFNAERNEIDIFITVPIKTDADGTIGVLAGRINLSGLTNIILSKIGSSKTGEIYLVSGDNRFLTKPRHEPKSERADSYGINQALTAPASEQNGQGIYENYNGVLVAGVYRWIAKEEIAVIVEMEEREALADIQQLRNTNILMAVVVLLVTFVVVAVISSFINQPIAMLTEAAIAIAGGDLEQTVTVSENTGNEIKFLAQSFNTMTKRLSKSRDDINEQARALETSSEISNQLVTILDIDDLLQYVVDRIQDEFSFYHTHIYLVEEGSGDLVMSEGSGEVGQKLKEKNHRLKAGQGIVGTVANSNEYFLSNDVNKLSNFVRNPLLLNTNAELAVPIHKGDKTLGVLDIQSRYFDRFKPTDVSFMQSIANQTAVAIDNARLLAEAQTTLREVEHLNRRLTREAWEQFSDELTTSGYRFRGGGRSSVTPAPDVWLPPMRQAISEKRLVRQTEVGNGGTSKAELAVPIVLRGEVIGVLGVKREKTTSWAEEEVTVIESVADQVARALENARLSKEQEKTIFQLKEIDRLKSEFLTSMSHELRTPLNSIIGFSDVLIQGIDGELPDLAMNDIKLIHNSGQHLLALINDILDLSKIEAGQMELVQTEVDLQETIADVLSASSSLFNNKPVEAVLNIQEGLPLIYADGLRIKQILLNLVSNAVKFTHEGDVIITARIYEKDPSQIYASVTDTGIGIPTEKLETIFDRFKQADSSTTRVYGGTGLGLAICKQLVEMHGGQLGVLSEVGVGSEFYFTIPIVQDVENE